MWFAGAGALLFRGSGAGGPPRRSHWETRGVSWRSRGAHERIRAPAPLARARCGRSPDCSCRLERSTPRPTAFSRRWRARRCRPRSAARAWRSSPRWWCWDARPGRCSSGMRGPTVSVIGALTVFIALLGTAHRGQRAGAAAADCRRGSGMSNRVRALVFASVAVLLLGGVAGYVWLRAGATEPARHGHPAGCPVDRRSGAQRTGHAVHEHAVGSELQACRVRAARRSRGRPVSDSRSAASVSRFARAQASASTSTTGIPRRTPCGSSTPRFAPATRCG